MRPAPFDFVAPTDLGELTGVLAEHGTGAAVLAGGQSLVPELNKRIRRPKVLVGLTGIPGLRECGADGEVLRIGARVTQQEACGLGGPLAEALRHVGYASTRNWGTVVGSIAYADPAGEIPATLLALGASVSARSVRGTRTVPLAQLYATAFRTTLAADEVLLEAVVPAVGPGWTWAFEQRSHRRRAKVSAVAGCGPDGALRLAVTGVGERPEPVTAGLAELTAAVVAADGIARACATVAAGCAAAVTHPGDLYGSSAYRRRLAAAAVEAALERAIRGSGSRTMTGDLTFSINGERHTARTPARSSLADVLRDSARLTGTNVGCREGWCGACTVLVDGRSARSCITLAVAVDGAAVTTVEGLAAADGTLSALQDAFVERGAMECGFCTPGFLMLGTELVAQVRAGAPVPSRAELVDVLSGNLCRCTGYDPIIDAVASVLEAAAHE